MAQQGQQQITDIKQQESVNKYCHLQNYQVGKTLGRGTFGKVKQAIHIPTKEKVAIKIINKKTIKDEDDQERINRQVEIMRVLRHPNIIQLYEIIETDDFIFLVTEYAEQGELFKLMAEEVRLSQRAAGRIFIQIMNAVQYMHRLGIAHRDLKPENILLDVDFNIKLIDFGLSNYVQDGVLLSTACGSPCYAPPEMVSGKKYDGKIGDMWSLGIIFYGMVCGSLPFEQKTTKELYKKVIQGFYVLPCDITMDAIEVIRKMLVTDPTTRITIKQLRNLPYFAELNQIQTQIIGLIVGFHPMPIDNEILQKMKSIIPFDKEQAQTQLKQNEQNNLTTTYYLLQKQSLRNGGKTIVDLQVFLETHEKYRQEYGVLPPSLNNNITSRKQQKQKQKQTALTQRKREEPISNRYHIHSKKGLSKDKRPPISLNKNRQSQKSKEKVKKNTISFSNEKLRKKTVGQTQYTPVKGNKLEQNEKRLKTSLDKYTHSRSTSEKKKKSLSRRKENRQNFALDIWHAYFEKPLQSTMRTSKMATSRKVKPSQQHKTKLFNDNIKKLKEGFLKLPVMKKEGKLSHRKNDKEKEL